ncbi:NAD(P)H-dependent oxidoreductase [Alteromonas sp. KUL49]|uniref:flavodoxin family protein n=1 Tax=Alteromonas sp. KUL49 TaxID=2480798 RepID=UPI00102EFF03|nr:NAD(P)H-dependent oxidoreductase [Alteromonas sp. KUL49]TAP35876.1 NADPH-dependent oxidoreductase [Alteromonas sp. KUL49]GEA13261.1 NAD(P)H-dependent oxidoreductase [Alteromonas sp. KUL49]
MPNNLVLFSSAREQGNTRRLLNAIEKQTPLDVVYLNALNLLPYDYDYKNTNDDFQRVLDRMLRCDNLIFASPIYWYSPTSQMKTLLDRFTDFLDIPSLKEKGKLLRNKTAYLVTTSSQISIDATFVSIFERTFDYLGIKYGGALHCQQSFIEHETLNIEMFARQIS